MVDPHSVLDVPLVIEAQALEEVDVVAQIAIFGSPDPPMVIHVYIFVVKDYPCYMSNQQMALM